MTGEKIIATWTDPCRIWEPDVDGAIIDLDDSNSTPHGHILSTPNNRKGKDFDADWRDYGHFLLSVREVQDVIDTKCKTRSTWWATLVIGELMRLWEMYMTTKYPWVPVRPMDEIPAVAEAKAEVREKLEAYALKHYGVAIMAESEPRLLQ